LSQRPCRLSRTAGRHGRLPEEDMMLPTITIGIAERFALPANDPLLLAAALPPTEILARIALSAILFAAVLVPALFFSERRGHLQPRAAAGCGHSASPAL
ncbi:MAG: hypothetical protein ACREQY_14875, partial [Candidatus Binatia bacterium]